MQSSQAPGKIQLPFAASGTKNAIPVPSQQGITPGAASYTDGFPPLTFTPKAAGGIPPAGADFNGILNAITALQQWKSAGGQFPFDATFAAAIGGYPKGATVLKADGTGLWISTAENNSTNPDTGGAGWLPFAASAVQSGSYSSAADTGTANAYAMTLSPAPSALTAGMTVTLLSIKATNTGASTLNVNALGALPIQKNHGGPLAAGDLIAITDAVFKLNTAGNAWNLVWSSAAYPKPHGQSIYTSSGTLALPISVPGAWISGCAAGGGGGCGASGVSGGNGGSAGQPVIKQWFAGIGGHSLSIVIGAGGNAGAAGNNEGTDGGNTTVTDTTSSTTLLTLSGGAGGYAGGLSGSPGQSNSFNSTGYPAGANGYVLSVYSFGGAGASGPFGAGGAQSAGGGGGAAQNASGYGAGGGAGCGNAAGGNGAPGIIVVEW